MQKHTQEDKYKDDRVSEVIKPFGYPFCII